MFLFVLTYKNPPMQFRLLSILTLPFHFGHSLICDTPVFYVSIW